MNLVLESLRHRVLSFQDVVRLPGVAPREAFLAHCLVPVHDQVKLQLLRMLLLELFELLLVLLTVFHVVDRRNSDLELVLSPCVGHDLPVMDALRERHVAEYVPEDVLLLLDVDVPVVRAHLEQLLRLLRVPLQEPSVFNVPDPVLNHNADDLSLGAEDKQVVELEFFPLAPERLVVHVLEPVLFLLLQLLHLVDIFEFLLICEILLKEQKNFILVASLHRLL